MRNTATDNAGALSGRVVPRRARRWTAAYRGRWQQRGAGAAALAVLACLAITAGPAQAAPTAPTASDETTAVEAQSEITGSATQVAGAATIDKVATADQAASENEAAGAAVRCWYVTWSRYYKNVFGKRLFTYYQRIDWCGNGRYVTRRSRNRYATVSWPGWEFKGHVGSQENGGVGWTGYRSWTQGRFCLASYFSCVQNKYPWIDMTVYGNGTWRGTQGG